MTVYTMLVKYVGRKTANIIIVYWYLAMLIMILYFMGYEQGEFRYGDY